MEAMMLIGAIIFFVIMKKSADKVENSTAYKKAAPEDQKRMLEAEEKKKRERHATASQIYDNGDETKTGHRASDTAGSNYTHTNPSSGLPMIGGPGGVDTSGRPYGL